MDVIRHDDIASDCPAVAIACTPPFVNQDFCDFLCGKNWSPFESACCDEIDRPINPNALQPTQMFAHAHAVAGIADPGQPENATGITDAGYNAQAPRRPVLFLD